MQNIDDSSLQSNIIQQTRDIIQNMTQEERFQLAKRHLMDALNNRIPRSDFETNNSNLFKYIYLIQTSSYWNLLLFFSSFVFMYIIIGEPNNRMHKNSKLNIAVVIFEGTILFLYWVDILFQIYHKLFWKVQWKQKFPQLFQLKFGVISLLTIDSIIYYSLYNAYPIRLFRIFRPFLPYFYNDFSRKAFQSFIGVYKDIIAYLVFYFSIIYSFGILGSQIIQLPSGTQFDWFKNNYNEIGQTGFLLYILASFDSWPDYWTLAVDSSRWYYIFYVAFIFLNFFYFVTIPTSVMFTSFKKTRSILMIIDEINKQNSLLLCFLCLGEDNLCIKSQTFHQFMLYAYRHKLRMVEQIKQLSFRLDENQDSDLFVSEFLNLCKVVEQKPQMYPPTFDDWEPYMKLRRFLKKKMYLKKIVNSMFFHTVVIVFALANILVIILSSFMKQWNSIIIEAAFMGFFVLEILMKLFGNGFQKFFNQVGNILETILLVLSLLLFILSTTILQSTVIDLLGIIRLFRFPLVINTLLLSDYLKRFYYRNIFFRKLRILFRDLYVSLVVGAKMFPLFMTLYYVLGIIGIEAYDESFLEQKSSPYSFYDQVANFRSFLLSQVVIVQSMVQAGWSMIIFDHAYRFGNTILVYLFFISIHVIIDTTIFSLMKGMVGDLYEAITLDFESIDKQQQKKLQNQLFEKYRRDQIRQIKQNIQLGIPLSYDTLKKKEIYEDKLDKRMMQSLRTTYDTKYKKKKIRSKPSQSYTIIHSSSFSIIRKPTKSNTVFDYSNSEDPLDSVKQPRNKLKQDSYEKSQKQDEQSFYSQEESVEQRSGNCQIDEYIMDRITLNMEEICYKQKPEHSQFLANYLIQKLAIAKYKKQKQGPFNPNFMSIKSPTSIAFYTTIIESLLNIKKPQEERKEQILNSILKQKAEQSELDEKIILAMLSKKQRQSINIIIQPIFRNIMLSGISQQFINKFQIEYFSSVYGNSFRQINSSTLEPLLHHQSLMLYGLSRVLRYDIPDVYTFWNMVGNIQENISRTLLEPGSIFAFAFEVEQLQGNWFVLQLKENMDVKVRFLKSGVWIHHKKMQCQQVYYAQDIFNCSIQTQIENPQAQGMIKLLYNTFETIGFSMFNQKSFFDYDPVSHSFDLFSFLLKKQIKHNNHNSPFPQIHKKIVLQKIYEKVDQQDNDKVHVNTTQNSEFDKENMQQMPYKLKISKMMGVILSRQNQRCPQDELRYTLTDIKKTKLELLMQNKKKKDFKFDQDESQTLRKLEQLAQQGSEHVIDYQSLEYAYLLQTMESIRDMCVCNYDNLIRQAQTILNIEFSKVNVKQ